MCGGTVLCLCIAHDPVRAFTRTHHTTSHASLSSSVSEKANFALTLTDRNGLLVAQASLYDYPNVEGVDQTAWEKWVPEKFNLAGAVVSSW